MKTAHAPPAAGSHVAKKLRDLDVALTATLPRVVEGNDEEAIHDMRVAIRRLRTLLKMSRSLFGRWHTDVVRRSFADVMRATGDLRDEEVLEETLGEASDHPDFVGWIGGRKARERRLYRAVVTRIERGDLDRARLMLKALLVFPVAPECEVDLARFARKTVERARRKVEQKRDVAPTDIVGLHDLRIAYKELRYSIELLAEALPIDMRAQLEPATVFQKRLGEIHDADVALEVLSRAKGMPVEVRDSALASLRALREKRLAKYLRELDPLGTVMPEKQGHHEKHHHEKHGHHGSHEKHGHGSHEKHGHLEKTVEVNAADVEAEEPETLDNTTDDDDAREAHAKGKKNGAPSNPPEAGEDAPTVHLQRRS